MASEPTFGARMQEIVDRRQRDVEDVDELQKENVAEKKNIIAADNYAEDIRRTRCLKLIEDSARKGHTVTGFYRSDMEYQVAKDGFFIVKLLAYFGRDEHGFKRHYPKAWDITYPKMVYTKSKRTRSDYVGYIADSVCYDFFNKYQFYIYLDGLSSIPPYKPIDYGIEGEMYNGAINVSINVDEPLFSRQRSVPGSCPSY